MKSIKIITRKGKKLQLTLDTSLDTELFSGFQNSGSRNQRWTDAYCHTGKIENHFYLDHYTRWENENNSIELISKEEMMEFLSEENLSGERIETMKKCGLVMEEA